MYINPLMYHQLIFHCSYQLRDKRKYRNILETDNWLNSVLLMILSHSPVCFQCCTHRHTCSVHNDTHRREKEIFWASLSKAMLRLWKLHTRRCHMNSNKHQNADLWKADTTEGVVAQASPLQALHPSQSESNSHKWHISVQPDPAAIFSLTVITLEQTLWLQASSNFGHTA